MTDARLAARTAALQDLIATRLARAGGRLGMAVSVAVVVLLAVSMPIVRHADGATAFFEGVVARGVTAHLVLVALPFALAVARLGRAWPGEPGVVALAEQAGFAAEDVAALVPGAAMRVAARRCALVVGPLALVAVVLSLPDGHVALRRLVATSLLVLLGALSAAGLAALAALLAGRVRKRAAMSLAALFLLPWLLGMVAREVPAYASFPGAYDALRSRILEASGR